MSGQMPNAHTALRTRLTSHRTLQLNECTNDLTLTVAIDNQGSLGDIRDQLRLEFQAEEEDWSAPEKKLAEEKVSDAC